MINGNNFDAVIERAKQAFGVRSDSALAELIQMKPTAFNNRKKSGSIPYDELIAAAIPRNVDISWLFTGIGAMKRTNVYVAPDSFEPPAAAEPAPKSQVRRELWDMLDGLEEEEQRLLLDEAAKIREMAQIKKRLAELEGKKRPKPKAGGTSVVFKGKVTNASAQDMNIRNYYGGKKGDE